MSSGLLPGVGDRAREATGTEFTDDQLYLAGACVIGIAEALLQNPCPPELRPVFDMLGEREKKMFLVNAMVAQLLPTYIKNGIVNVEKAAEWTGKVRDAGSLEEASDLFS